MSASVLSPDHNIPPLLTCLFVWQVAESLNNVQDLEIYA